MQWDDSDRKNIKELASIKLGFLAGCIILLPSFMGVIQPPHIYKLSLLIFLTSTCIAFVFLSFTVYWTFTKSDSSPYRAHGIGTWFSVLAFGSISFYLLANLASALNSSPVINDINILPHSPTIGNTVKLNAIATDKDKDNLKYAWTINGTKASSESYAFYYIKMDEKEIKADLEVTDSSGNSANKSITIRPGKGLR